jgi:molecular chaperone Hsp33
MSADQPDILKKAFSASSRIRFTYVDTSRAAADLQERHLSGPCAALVLGQGLAASALLIADRSHEDECVSIQLHADGPIGGMMVEAHANGALRGYTNQKILHDFDGEDHPDVEKALGEKGQARIIRSTSKSVLFTAAFPAEPPDVRTLLARYFNYSMQTPSAVALQVDGNVDEITLAKGIVAERMPDGLSEHFITILEAFERGDVAERLRTASGPEDFADLFELPDIVTGETQSLRFECRCSKEKVTRALNVLTEQDMKSIIAEGKGQDVYCHMCGKGYTISTDEIQGLLDDKQAG